MTDYKIGVILDSQEAEALIAYHWRRIVSLSKTEATFPSHSALDTINKIESVRQILDSIESLCNAIRSKEE